AYGYFTDAASAKKFAAGRACPIVVKADGLAGGKGVIIAQDAEDAEDAIDSMFEGMFGDSGRSVVIEEFLEGEEVSFFALCDGETAAEFGYAQDHKRAFDGDQGPNTGGMGAYSPTPVMTDALRKTVMKDIILPTVQAMKKEGHPFRGVLFAGLMLTKDGPKLLEYNVRFGDPETQPLMMRFDGDLYEALLACSLMSSIGCRASDKKFGAAVTRHLSPDTHSICVVMAARGYPGAYEKGSIIKGLDAADRVEGVKIFHAGTEKRGDDMAAVGGRVLGVTAIGGSIAEAQIRAYRAIDLIRWPQGFCRRDIAWRALATAG
ncbi:MAG: phosphoribosylamine--glycine ligase, partial [Pseudomonadota bacterium]|nr:phosphoribosylamine--glycine ligase [Pseudomonadota bacterium]